MDDSHLGYTSIITVEHSPKSHHTTMGHPSHTVGHTPSPRRGGRLGWGGEPLRHVGKSLHPHPDPPPSQGEGRCAPCADTVAPEGNLYANVMWTDLEPL